MSRSTILFFVFIGLHQLVCSQSNPDDYWLGNGFSRGDTVTTNAGWFYDDGGDGLYNEEQDWNVTFCSENGNPITLDFSGFRTHFGGTIGDETWAQYDYISVNYEGTDGWVAYHNDTPEFSFTSPDGCMNVRFISDSDGQIDSGWVAEIFAVPPPSNNAPGGAVDLVVGNSCSPSFYTNKGAYSTTNLGSPDCKDFFGGDVWFRLVVPDSGVVSIETFPGTLTYAVLDIYRSADIDITEGERITCVVDVGIMPSITLTSADGIAPGDVLYIRLFGEQAKSGLFGICATDPSAPVTGYTGPGGVGDSASLDFWYKADRGLLNGAAPVSDGDQVTTWEDQSGNDAHLVQLNSSIQPNYIAGAVNGFGTVDFDAGSGDMLTVDLGSADAPLHWFAAGAFDGLQRQTLLSVGDGALDKTASISRHTDGRYFSFTGTDRYGPVLSDGFFLFNAAHLLDAPYHFLELNGTSQSVLAEAEPLLSNGVVQVGASWDGSDPFNGTVSELIQYKKSLNSAQEIIINNYLSAKYDIEIPVAIDYFAYKEFFYYDVAGIGRVDAANIHTKAESAGVLAISGASDLDNNEYLFFGHNNGDFSTWSDANVPAGDTNIVRLDRVWRVGLEGLPGEVSVSLTKSVLPPLPSGFSAYNILVDSDGDFSSGAMTYGPFEIGNELVMNQINLNDGDHIAIAAVRPVVSFTTAADSALESVNNPQIEVVLNYAVSTIVEIDYTVVDATATQGVDFSLLPSTISIDPGNKSGYIIPLIIDDTIPEIPNEYFDIQIATSTPGVTAAGITRARHIIMNDDLAIEVSASDTIIGACDESFSEITVEPAGTGPYTYSWTLGTGLNVTDNDTVLANPSVTTTYTVEVTDTYGLSKTKDIEIVVVPAPSAPTITVDGSVILCMGDSVKLSAPKGYAGYLWSTSETTDSIWVKSSGDYNAIVTDSFGCISPVSADISITVNPLPDNSLVVDDPAVCAGETASITVSGSESVVNYHLRLDSDDSVVDGPVAGDGGEITFEVTPVATTTYNILATNVTTGCSAELTDMSTVTVNPLPDNNLTVNDPTVCAGETASITVSGSESVVNYHLRLDSDDSVVDGPVTGDGGDITFEVTPVATTTYNILATNVTTGCSAELTDMSTVTVNPLPDKPDITPSGPIAICQGGSVVLSAPEASSWLWSTGETTKDITVTSAEVITVMVTDANGCSSENSDAVTVTVNPLPDNSLVVGDPAVCAGETATITVSGSEIGVDYQLRLDSDDSVVDGPVTGDGGEITFEVTPVATTTYNILATNGTTGCSAELTDMSTVAVNPLPDKPDITPSGPIAICQGGSVVLSAPEASSWLWSTGETTKDITVTSAEVITVMVTDANGCSSENSDAVTVTVNPLPDNSLVVGDPAVCAGETATITVSGSESVVNYQLRLDSDDSVVDGPVTGDGGDITFDVTPVATTTYNILATNVTTGCSAELTDMSTVTVNPLPDNNLTVNDPTVCAGETASITVSGSESVVNYHLRLDSDDSVVDGPVTGDGGDITFDVTPVATTTYNILATNGTTGCSAELTDMSTVTVNPLPDNNLTVNDPTVCAGEAASITVSGSESVVNYHLRLDSDDSVVDGPVTGDGGEITFEVTPVATTTYNILATKVTTGCSAELTDMSTVTVNPLPDKPDITPSGPIAICQGGSVVLSAPEASSWLWSTGETTKDITVTSAEVITVMVTDANGCSSENSDAVTVTVNPLPDNSLVVGDPAVCAGETATITVSGSEIGVDYQLRLDSDDSVVDGPVTGDGGDITFDVTPVATTTYNILATNVTTGCSAELTDMSTVTVNPLPDKPDITPSGPIAICQGGSVVLSAPEASSWLWSTGETTKEITVTSAEVITVMVTDANGCSSENSDAVTVTVNPLPDNSLVVGDPAVCAGETAMITVSGSEIGVDYQLRLNSDDSDVGLPVTGDGNNITFEVTPVATTTYNILATNVTTGCSAELTDMSTVTVNPLPEQPEISADGSLFIITGNSVQLSGPPAAGYLWTPGGETTQSISVSTSGSYTLFVENEFGCLSPESEPVEVVVSDFLPPPTVTVSGSLEFCDGGSVELSGPDGFEQYNWSDGNTGQSVSVSEEVEITLVVTNSEGVESLPSEVVTVVVNELPEIQVLDKIEASCYGFDDGSITVGVTGGLEPYQYSWQGYQESSSTLSGIPAGNYTSTVIDENGCTESLGIELGEPVPITVEEVVEPVYCPDFADGSIELVISGGTSPYYITWSGGGTTDYINNLSPGDYSYEVKDENNCQVDGTIQLGYVNEVCFIVPGIITPNDDGFNDTWRIEGLEVYPDVIVEIFDRWGKRVFYSEGYDTEFDGTYDGRELPMESYHYMIDLHNGSERIIGNITIVR